MKIAERYQLITRKENTMLYIPTAKKMSVNPAHSFIANGVTVNIPEHFRSKTHLPHINGGNLILNYEYFGFDESDFDRPILATVEVEAKTTVDLERSFTKIKVYKQQPGQPDYYLSIAKEGDAPILNSRFKIKFAPIPH